MSIAENIKKIRLEHELSQADLGKIAGVSDKAVSTWELGIKIPLMGAVEKMANYFGIPKSAILDDAQPAPASRPIPPGFEPMPKMKKIPLIGSIACGEPITAEQNIEKMVDVPENIRCDFSLTCHGDSMVDAGIHDKDVVYIRIQPEVENGEIAAVRIDGEATLKRVYYNPGTLTLMPANPAYAPMIYAGPQLEEVHIEGKAVGWTHWVG